MRSKKTFLSIAFNLLLQVVVIIYGFIIPKIIISNFGSEVNGLITSITQFLAYITLLESGFGPVVKSILYKPIAKKNDEEICNILKTTEVFFRKISKIFIIYIIMLSLVYPIIISNQFDFVFTVPLIFIIAISNFFEYYFGITYRLFLQADQKSYIISIIQIVTYLLNVVLIVIVVKLGFNVYIVKLVGGCVFALRPILQNYYVKRKYLFNLSNYNGNYKIDNKWDGMAQHIASVINNNTDVAILTFFCNISEVSVYSVYALVVTGVRAISQSLTTGVDAMFGNMIANNERDNLKKKFNLYELFFVSANTIIYTSCFILIIPFIKIYTSDIKDVNYIRPLFGCLLTIAYYAWAIRQPYNEIIRAAGHFKETKNGAWFECIVNIIISIILVWKYGIVGVAIGTITAISIRTVELILYTNKHILKRSSMESICKLIVLLFETTIVSFAFRYIPLLSFDNYAMWLANSLIVVSITSIFVLTSNYLLFKKECLDIIKLIKKIIKAKTN